MAIAKWRALEAHDDANEVLEGRRSERYEAESDLQKLDTQVGRSIYFRDPTDEDRKKLKKIKGKIGSSAYEQLRSPQGRIVGRQLEDALGLSEGWSDPTSERWESLRSDVEDPAIQSIDEGVDRAGRALNAAGRAGEQEMRDRTALRGSGRNPMAEKEDLFRYIERLGTAHAQIQSQAGAQKAEVRGQVSQWMHTMTREYAQDTVKFARDWTTQAPFIRAEFQDRLDLLAIKTSEADLKEAAQLLDYQTRKDIQDMQEDQEGGWITVTLGAVLAVVGAYYGGGQGAAMGWSTGSQIGGLLE